MHERLEHAMVELYIEPGHEEKIHGCREKRRMHGSFEPTVLATQHEICKREKRCGCDRAQKPYEREKDRDHRERLDLAPAIRLRSRTRLPRVAIDPLGR